KVPVPAHDPQQGAGRYRPRPDRAPGVRRRPADRGLGAARALAREPPPQGCLRPATGSTMDVKGAWPLVKHAVKSWSDDYAPSMGAAIAYYTVFSIAP